jgi:hypothetical protein
VRQSPIELALTAAEEQTPDEGLRTVAALRERLDALEGLHVENAVRAGWSWRQVADVLGVTKQAVHKKHAKRVAEKRSAEPGADDVEHNRLLVTGPARESVQFAREEAAALCSSDVAPEHLLVGLLRDDRGPVVRALGSLGISLEHAREEVARLHARRRPPRARAVESPAAGERLPVSAAARDVMEQALREAVKRRDGHLGVEHLLLALLRDRRAVPARALVALGTTGDEIERALDQVLGRG